MEPEGSLPHSQASANKNIKRINILKRNNTKTVNTSTHIARTPTHYNPPPHTHTYIHKHIHTHTPHITKQVKTTTVQDTHQIK